MLSLIYGTETKMMIMIIIMGHECKYRHIWGEVNERGEKKGHQEV
jgi:hypothetical protein